MLKAGERRGMSVKLMAEIWPQVMDSGKKFVLLAFADAANDDGITWIALESQRGSLDLCRKVSMHLRSVRRHVASLEKEGRLERQETRGKGCIWLVRSTPHARPEIPSTDPDCTPDKLTGVQEATPVNLSPEMDKLTGEPLLNRQEKKKTGEAGPVPVDKCPIVRRPLPAGVTLTQWEAFLDMRVSLGKRVRAYVAQLVLSNLDAIAAKGWHPGDVLDRSTVNAWPDVYEPEAGRVTGVRRIVAGRVADPVGMSEGDRAELSRIDRLADAERAHKERGRFMARVERRNDPTSIGDLIGQLPLAPPFRGAKR